MSMIPFKVSARAARLIGRENVSNAEGAIIELVKNCYDADANSSLIFFENHFRDIPVALTSDEYSSLLSYDFDLSPYYSLQKGKYILKSEAKEDGVLLSFFLSFNVLYIFDDGSGMSLDVIKNSWMTIGTDNKATNFISEKGRVRTGAKGIGRFALDRLGSKCEMWTIEKNSDIGQLWIVDWEDFESEGKNLDDVYANVREINRIEFTNTIQNLILNKIDLAKYKEDQLENFMPEKYTTGTLLKISGLRDVWNDKYTDRVFASLDSLIPPREQRVFDIFMFVLNSSKLYGGVYSSACYDYDYKLEATVDGQQLVKIVINRDELDLDKIDHDLFKLNDFKAPPVDIATFQRKEFELKYHVKELLPRHKDKDLSTLSNFSFHFYFIKRDGSDDDGKYPYKYVDANKRRSWLNRNGGIKIFRDYFKVRPYGDPNSASFDWLKLSERVQRSPAGVGKSEGAWHVRANQVSGSIFISRLHNVFEDKSSREGVQETEDFEIFQELIIAIIREFEKDRQKIMRALKQLRDKKDEKDRIKNEGSKLADETIKNKGTESQQNTTTEPDSSEKIEQLKKDNLLLAQSVKTFQEVVEEKESELRLIRALAGTGIALTSLSHEIKTVVAPFVSRNVHLKSLIQDAVIDLSKHEKINTFIDLMIEKDKVLKGWLDVSLNIVSKDKRKRKQLNPFDTINRTIQAWLPALNERNIDINIHQRNGLAIDWRAYVIDIESIFNNLIINSFTAFQSKEHQGERAINITIIGDTDSKSFEVLYQDSGPGLSEVIKDKNEIFEPFFSTSSDEGTGLGMWIVKTTVMEYKGTVEILDSEKGFELKFTFPLRNE
ncbi:sensor histidine kinase [Brevibacillus sp. AG]|uniref:sensor histidine kinase n=1 Tax=Brevibacillus sp. AG TaxID=3020891 RepID=UPI00232E3BEE|nr:sensor histidine kinase [Brevibacillus sp. AG]MDC0764751.1 sensor histidine kinase [Brevibacillus sp. AG]